MVESILHVLASNSGVLRSEFNEKECTFED